jgi:hypothetical protein
MPSHLGASAVGGIRVPCSCQGPRVERGTRRLNGGEPESPLGETLGAGKYRR